MGIYSQALILGVELVVLTVTSHCHQERFALAIIQAIVKSVSMLAHQLILSFAMLIELDAIASQQNMTLLSGNWLMTMFLPKKNARNGKKSVSISIKNIKKAMTNIGICGAHRTGKTTLAKAVAKALSMPFVEIGTSAIFAKNSLDPAKPMDFRTRLYIQQQILKHAIEIWFEMDEAFICDRTPIDMMAYTLAEVQGETLDKELEWELAEYLRDCKEATEKYFHYLFLVPPAIPITAAKGKASLSRGYIEHIHLLCLALFQRTDGSEIAELCTVSLDDRVAEVRAFMGGRY